MVKFGSDCELIVGAPTVDVRGEDCKSRDEKVGEDARGQRRCEYPGVLVSSRREEGVLWLLIWIAWKFWEVVEKSLCVVKGATSDSWDTQ